jgi:hypothetical protein
LLGDKCVAQHHCGCSFDFFEAAAELNSTLAGYVCCTREYGRKDIIRRDFFETSLSTSTSMDLCLYDPKVSTEFFGSINCVGGGGCGDTRRNLYAIGAKEVLGLILMKLHQILGG